LQRFPGRDRGRTIQISEMLDLLKQPAMIFLGLLMMLYSGSEMGINAWIVRYFEDELLNGNKIAATLHVSLLSRDLIVPVTTGVFLTLYWFSMTVGRLLVTFAGRLVPDYLLLRVITTCAAAAGLGIFIAGSVVPATVFLVLTGLFFSGIFATTIAIGANRFPNFAGSVSGIIIGFSGFGIMLMNSGIGEIAQRAGSVRAGMLFAAVLLFGMAACSFAIKKDKSAKSFATA